MALQLDAAQHILIKTLLKEGFETKLIALEASCSLGTTFLIGVLCCGFQISKFEEPKKLMCR